MPTVRVTCLLCEHPVEVPASAVVLHLDEREGPASNRYGFSCPRCAVYVVRRANQAIVDALVDTDEVRVATGTLPPWETGDRPGIVLVDAGRTEQGTGATPQGAGRTEQAASSQSRPPQAPPITEADVLLFRKALEDDAIMAAWLAG